MRLPWHWPLILMVLVNNHQELSHLGFTSNYRHEQAVFRLMDKYGFPPDFQSNKFVKRAARNSMISSPTAIPALKMQVWS